MVKIKNVAVYGLEKSAKVSGYPMSIDVDKEEGNEEIVKRMTRLTNTGNGEGHANALKGIIVQFDITYPQYFSMQLQRYHWAEIVSSQSKMHRITKMNISDSCNKYVTLEIRNLIEKYKAEYLENQSYENFMKVISNLPMGFEMTMGMTTNYLQLKTIYLQRKNHKLSEDWGAFCSMIKDLPMSEWITREPSENGTDKDTFIY